MLQRSTSREKVVTSQHLVREVAHRFQELRCCEASTLSLRLGIGSSIRDALFRKSDTVLYA